MKNLSPTQYILAVLVFSLAMAVFNNMRVDESKQVDWIGSQKILPKPEELF